MNKAHLTAISRKKLSAPMAWLEKEGIFDGIPTHPRLDYGCGKGYDADVLNMQKYDPFYFKCDDFRAGEFDIITCNFVLNVIESAEERQRVLDQIEHWLAPGMTAYITIRADKDKLKGYTKKGTWQGYVPPNLPLFHKGHGYEMYAMKKGYES